MATNRAHKIPQSFDFVLPTKYITGTDIIAGITEENLKNKSLLLICEKTFKYK